MSRNPSARRAPVYGPVHKAHRYVLGSALMRLGATDFADSREAAAAARLVRDVIRFSADHLDNEDRHLHPLLRAIAEDHVLGLETAHEGHAREFETLGRLADAAEGDDREERVRKGSELYLRFARFVAQDLEHMDFEERVIEPLLHARYSDEELGAVHHAIVATMSQEELHELAELAGKALNRSEQQAVAALFDQGREAA
ncbi:MAG TPA: hypothetical protein VEC14_00030 [Reyranellaceae bacterium]|nr:hypothetical protein [Reyranellaceae bacterium]